MTVEFDREYPLQEGGTARYYKVGDWGFEYILNKDGTVDAESDASIEYAERAIAAWTEWRDWLKVNLPKPNYPKAGEVWLLSQKYSTSSPYQEVPAVVQGDNFRFPSAYGVGSAFIKIDSALNSWGCKRIWPVDS